MSNFYYIDKHGNQKGPVDENTLKSLGLPSSTYIYSRELKVWKHLSDVFPGDKCAEISSRETGANHNIKYQYIKADKNQTGTATIADMECQSFSRDTQVWIKEDKKWVTLGQLIASLPNYAPTHSDTVSPEPPQPPTPTPQPPTPTPQQPTPQQPTPQQPTPVRNYFEKEKRTHTLAIVQLVLCLLFFFPLALLFQFLANVHFETISTTPSSSAPIKLAKWLTHYWPSIVEVVALICAIISTFSDDQDDKSKFLITSFGLSIFMIIMGIVMIFNPEAAMGIIFILVVIGIVAAWISSQKK